jgi:hypothetical protein
LQQRSVFYWLIIGRLPNSDSERQVWDLALDAAGFRLDMPPEEARVLAKRIMAANKLNRIDFWNIEADEYDRISDSE